MNTLADKQFCALGSVKSNIGHLEGAAGIAGLTKVLLQMKHRQFVPSLHAEAPNPDINFEESPFYVRSELSEWQQPVVSSNGASQTFRRRAGISSFGAGGSNAHVLIEEYVDQTTPADTSSPTTLVCSSCPREAKNDCAFMPRGSLTSLRKLSSTPKEVANRPTLADIAYTLQIGREPLEERLAVVAQTHHAVDRGIASFR